MRLVAWGCGLVAQDIVALVAVAAGVLYLVEGKTLCIFPAEGLVPD
jgi:hypothetical protein